MDAPLILLKQIRWKRRPPLYESSCPVDESINCTRVLIDGEHLEPSHEAATRWSVESKPQPRGHEEEGVVETEIRGGDWRGD